jgi:hypothetical protein
MIKGATIMQIKEYYEGFSDEQIKRYRNEVKKRWGKNTLTESEARVTGMGKEKFAALQVEGGVIFQTLCDNMPKGVNSQVASMAGEFLPLFQRSSARIGAGL